MDAYVSSLLDTLLHWIYPMHCAAGGAPVADIPQAAAVTLQADSWAHVMPWLAVAWLAGVVLLLGRLHRIAVSRETVRRCLHEAQLVWRRPRPVLRRRFMTPKRTSCIQWPVCLASPGRFELLAPLQDLGVRLQ